MKNYTNTFLFQTVWRHTVKPVNALPEQVVYTTLFVSVKGVLKMEDDKFVMEHEDIEAPEFMKNPILEYKVLFKIDPIFNYETDKDHQEKE